MWYVEWLFFLPSTKTGIKKKKIIKPGCCCCIGAASVQRRSSSDSAVLPRRSVVLRYTRLDITTVRACVVTIDTKPLSARLQVEKPHRRISAAWNESSLTSLILTRIFRPQVYVRPWNSFPPPQCDFSFLIHPRSRWSLQLHVCTSSDCFRVRSPEPCVYWCAAEEAQQESVSLFWDVGRETLPSASIRRFNSLNDDGEERQER